MGHPCGAAERNRQGQRDHIWSAYVPSCRSIPVGRSKRDDRLSSGPSAHSYSARDAALTLRLRPDNVTVNGRIPTPTHREVVAQMNRAEERAAPEDVGEQALMRGLVTAFPFFRLGLSCSSIGRRSADRPHNGFQEFPCRGPALTPAQLMVAVLPLASSSNGGAVGRSSASYDSSGPQPRATLRPSVA